MYIMYIDCEISNYTNKYLITKIHWGGLDIFQILLLLFFLSVYSVWRLEDNTPRGQLWFGTVLNNDAYFY